MKLSIQHLQHYPIGEKNGLKGLFRGDVVTLTQNGMSSSTVTGFDLALFSTAGVIPLLYDMSFMYKEILVDGKKIIPIVELAKIEYPEKDWKCGVDRAYFNDTMFLDNFAYSKGCFTFYNQMITKPAPNQWSYFMKMFEWKLDVFQLIPVNLALPVTDDLNPYI